MIIKSVQYVLNPSEYYSTVWHKEGKTENILASGIYYYEMPSVISGTLEFKIKDYYMSLKPQQGKALGYELFA